MKLTKKEIDLIYLIGFIEDTIYDITIESKYYYIYENDKYTHSIIGYDRYIIYRKYELETYNKKLISLKDFYDTNILIDYLKREFTYHLRKHKLSDLLNGFN